MVFLDENWDLLENLFVPGEADVATCEIDVTLAAVWVPPTCNSQTVGSAVRATAVITRRWLTYRSLHRPLEGDRRGMTDRDWR